jgi:hypothetical protein
MNTILLLVACARMESTLCADSFRAWYCPFGVNVNGGIDSKTIEGWHELTSLIGDKGERFEEIIRKGQSSKEFRDWDVRIKAVRGGVTTLIDGLGNVRRGKTLTTLPLESFVSLKSYIATTLPNTVFDVEFSPARAFPTAPKNYQPVVAYRPGAFGPQNSRDFFDISSLVRDHLGDLYGILKIKEIQATFDVDRVWLMVIDANSGFIEVDVNGNCRRKGESWSMPTDMLRHLRYVIVGNIPGRPRLK